MTKAGERKFRCGDCGALLDRWDVLPPPRARKPAGTPWRCWPCHGRNLLGQLRAAAQDSRKEPGERGKGETMTTIKERPDMRIAREPDGSVAVEENGMRVVVGPGRRAATIRVCVGTTAPYSLAEAALSLDAAEVVADAIIDRVDAIQEES